MLLFLVVRPEDLGGFEAPSREVEMHKEKAENEEVGLLGVESLDSLEVIGFLQAWRLLGVAPFAFCLFFSKLVAYTFLHWLPFYLRHTGVASKQLSHKTVRILSIISTLGWNSVFLVLIVSILLVALLLICVAKIEIQQKLSEAKWVWNSMTSQ